MLLVGSPLKKGIPKLVPVSDDGAGSEGYHKPVVKFSHQATVILSHSGA